MKREGETLVTIKSKGIAKMIEETDPASIDMFLEKLGQSIKPFIHSENGCVTCFRIITEIYSKNKIRIVGGDYQLTEYVETEFKKTNNNLLTSKKRRTT